jgi:hypothetical protein
MGWKDDLNYGLAAFGLKIPDRLPVDEWAAKLADHPARNVTGFVALATVLFYAAERGKNPKVKDIYDAMIYCTTNISVGYSDIFAQTPAGKAIGSLLMTLGPAMAAKALDGPKDGRPAGQDDLRQAQILETLQQILEHLKAQQQADASQAAASPEAAV